MARFNDLPVELRVVVAKHIANGDKPYTNLKALALVCRQLAPIAQEVLLSAPQVDNFIVQRRSPAEHTAFCEVSHGLSKSTNPDFVALGARLQQAVHAIEADPASAWVENIKLLCNFLDDRPALAQKIRSADITLVGSAEVVIMTILAPRETKYPTCRIAILLSLLRGLQSLSLKLKAPFNIPSGEYFGCLTDENPGYTYGFENLTSLTVNFLPPWRALKLPALRTLHIDLRAMKEMKQAGCDLETMCGFPENVGSQHGFMLVMIFSKIDTLILDLDVEFLVENDEEGVAVEYVYEVLGVLTRILEALENLHLRVHYKGGSRVHDHLEGLEYKRLQRLFRRPTLRSLFVDTSDVDWDRYAINDDDSEQPNPDWTAEETYVIDDGDETYPNRISTLTGLCRLVCPQEALFYHYISPGHQPLKFDVVHLPSSIESIGIINSTRALNHWAKYVLEHPNEFPNLEKVVLWCDKYENALVPDRRIRAAAKPPADGTLLDASVGEDDERGIIRLADTVPDTVWNDFQNAGYSLVIHRERERGWREAA